MTKHTILFLAANPSGTDRLALDREARAIQAELERSGQRDRFEFETRWAAEPLDLLRELRELKPVVVHFSGHGGQRGLFFQSAGGDPQLVSTAALAEAFGAAGSSVRLVVLDACDSEAHADALLAHVDYVVGVSASIQESVARSFAIGFYGGLGESEPISAAYRQGCAAISLEGLPDGERPRLKVRAGVSADEPLFAEAAVEPTGAGAPESPVARPREEAADRRSTASESEEKQGSRAPIVGMIALGVVATVAVIAAVVPRGSGEPRRGTAPVGSGEHPSGTGDGRVPARLEEVKRKLAGLEEPPPPPATCAPAAATEAGELFLAARDKLATDARAAIGLAARAIERCPGWAGGHHVHGNALTKADRLEDAAEAYARALTLAPDYDAPRFNLGLVQLRRKEPAAIETFTTLIRRTPDLPGVYSARGRAYLLAKQYGEALADLEQAVRRTPDDGRDWLLIGEARRQLGRPDSVQAFCRAAELGQDQAAARCKP